ncbi:putative quinol monooxygenase [Nocardiopsis coralliicola]
MVEVALAFACALVAWSATAALIARGQRVPGTYPRILAASAAAVAIGLSAAFPGALLGFSGITFRLLQVGVGLLGPLLAAWGAVEYAIRSERARFGVRLLVAVLGIVPTAVLALDPVSGNFSNDYPPLNDHYDFIPGIAVSAVHIFAAAAIAVCAAAALRAGGRAGTHRASVVGLIGLAVLLEILVARMGLGALGQVVMVGALAALWGAFVRALNPPEEPQRRRRGRRSPSGGGDPDDGEGDDEVWGRRRRARDDDYDDYDDDGFADERDEVRSAPAGRGGRSGRGAPRRPRMRGIITIYTLANGGADTFDDCADAVVDEVDRREPDTLLFACHTVPSAPQQRIVYAIYRDELAQEEHEQQPHVREFARRSAPAVVATNVIELSLAGASVADSLPDMLMPR